MLQALSAFNGQPSSEAPAQQLQQQQPQQRESDRDDSVTVALRTKQVKVRTVRDTLFLAVHGLILESGT